MGSEEEEELNMPEPEVSYEACVLGIQQITHKINLFEQTLVNFKLEERSKTEYLVKVKCHSALASELRDWELKMLMSMTTLKDEKQAIKKRRPELDACSASLEKSLIRLEDFKNYYANDSKPLVDRSNAFKLERIKLKQFSGQFEEWQEFKDLFHAAVDSNPSYSGAEKMFYLKSSLTGDALSVVSSFPSTSASYTEAWKLVQRRYDNQREIVFAHIRKLDFVQKVSETSSGIRKLIDILNECVRSLKSHKVPVEKWDVILCYMVTKKLDEETRKSWLLTQDTSLPVLEDLMDFLETRATALNEPTKPKSRVQKSANVAIRAAANISCPKCTQIHYLNQCEEFKKLCVSDRSTLVKSKSLCFNCFKPGHGSTKCQSKYSCRVCGNKHHSMLHKEGERSNPQQQTQHQSSQKSEDSSQAGQSSSHCAIPSVHSNHVLLGTLLANVRDCTGQRQVVRVFVDNGSESCFISENCVDRLGLSRKKSCVTISGIAGSNGIPTKGMVQLTLYSRFENYSLNINALVLGKVTSDLPRVKGQSSFPHIKGLNLSDPLYFQPRPTDILLGAEFSSRIKLSGIIHGPLGTPSAEETHFGWMLTGNFPTTQHQSSVSSHHAVRTSSYHSSCNARLPCLEMKLEKFWEIEESNFVQSSEQAKHKELEDSYLSSTTRDADGRFVVHLPFLKNHQSLGESRSIAIHKFKNVEKRIHQVPSLIQSYNKYFEDHLKSGMMELVPSNEVNVSCSKSYYMPYREVVKDTSTTTKVRIVYNCSSKTRQGPSLNDILDKGPKLQNDLIPLLIRFRSYPYVFSCDITKFYNQFKVVKEHVDFQRLVWRKSPDEDFEDYRLVRLTFGVTSAPYLSIRTFNHLVDQECQHAKFKEIMKKDILVDNFLTGSDTLQEALELQKVVRQVCEKGKLELRQWASNSLQLLESIPSTHRETQNSLVISDEESLFTLGLKWFPSSDNFCVLIPEFSDSELITKRSVLSHVARVFDPLGWISPVTIRAKIFLQKLWKEKYDWDTPLPHLLQKEWTDYQEDLILHQGFTIERCFTPSENESGLVDLIGFCDASNVAYSAVVYSRWCNSEGQGKIILIKSKTKVAPVRGDTTPRLELCGAALLVKLVKLVCESVSIKFNSIMCFTDSTNVIDWLNSQEKLPVFVHNRVRTILEGIPSATWFHCDGKDNPADAPSRGIKSLLPSAVSDLWLNGSTWLSTFNLSYVVNHQMKEEGIMSNFQSTIESLLHNRSEYHKVIRLIGWWIRYLSCLKTKPKVTGELNVSELENSLYVIIRVVQGHSFNKEIRLIKNQQPLHQSSIKFMSPFLDGNGILRVGGRLKNSQFGEDKKHPILLPTHHPFVINLIRHYHLNNCHAGPSLLLALLREKYWVVKGKVAVNKVVKSCVSCHLANPVALQQVMGNLPSSRVNPSRAFSHSGMDFAGPFTIRVTSGRNPKYLKSYICIFVCMATKAIHIELVQDLSTPSFLAALHRFVSRRGLPSDLYSDGGKNFIGAKNELEEVQKFLSQSLTNSVSFLSERGIQFHVNPPLSPHHGGLFEAAVKSAKSLLCRLVHDHILTIEEFSTLLCQIEATLNCRPLSPMSDDPNDYSILTPGHFLVMGNLKHVPEIDLTDLNSSRVSRWQLVQQLHQHFWRRWSTEYLHLLQSRPKWLKIQKNLCVGDLVLLQQGSKSIGSTKWVTARVEKVFPGDDGQVRVAEVRTSDGSTFRRPIVRLSPLPINEEN